MINIIVILAVVAATQAQAVSSNLQRSSTIQIDKYIEINREQYSKMLKVYDDQIEKFKQNYLDRVNATNITKSCLDDLNSQVNSLLFSVLNVKNSFNNYITHYEKEVEDCGKDVRQSTRNYAICVVGATFKTNKLTNGNRREFNIVMANAECIMKIYYKSNWECYYAFEKA